MGAALCSQCQGRPAPCLHNTKCKRQADAGLAHKPAQNKTNRILLDRQQATPTPAGAYSFAVAVGEMGVTRRQHPQLTPSGLALQSRSA